MSQNSQDGAALFRIAWELREMLANAPKDDADAKSLLGDCLVLERVGKWLINARPIQLTVGEPTNLPFRELEDGAA